MNNNTNQQPKQGVHSGCPYCHRLEEREGFDDYVYYQPEELEQLWRDYYDIQARKL